MSTQEFISYIGTVHSSISGSTGEYLATSISLNFESDRVALSTSNVSNYTGRVDIHDYGTNWTKIFSLSGPDGQNSSFGHEISLNWSGTRLAVSAYEVNKVYILDAIGTGSNIWSSYVSNTLNTSSLSLPGTAEFGYSISLAQDDGNRIVVGAPGQNKVYVYEYDSANNNWGSGPVWSSTDSGINNVLAYAVDSSGLATSYIHAHAISNRYGHKVRLSAFGNYLIIGAPGETDATIDTTTAYYPEGSTTNYTGSYTGQHQIGHVRCYTNDGDTWASGTTQYGQDIRGKAGTAIGTDNQPSFGTSCDISTNGNKITVSSPYKQVSTLANAGQIDTYLINDDLDTWLSVSTSIAGAKSGQKLGMNHRLDFAGERLATGDLATPNQESAYYGGISLYAFDFGTDRWYDITRPIQLHDWPTVGSNDHNPVDITNGKIIAISDPRDPPGSSYSSAGTSGIVVFYQFPLTNAIQGNTSVGGYVKCENLYVGANDNSTNTDHTIANKRISFGGTIRDNSYEETYIENRSVDGAGKSELLLYKRNDIWDKAGGNPHSTNPENMVDDSIRIKAAEICLDYEDTNLHGTYPNASVRNTRFLLNRSGQIALGNAYYNDEFDVVTDIDVNDKSFFWTTVNIGNKTNKPPNLTPALNTNNERLFVGLSTSSTSIGKDGKYGNQTFERYNVSSQAWDGDEFAFYFSDSNATIYEDSHPGNWHGTAGQFSCWIKLNNTQANCAGVLGWFGQDHHREEYTPGWTDYGGGLVKLTSSGLQFEYEYNSANVQTVSYTFNQGSWYHVAVCFPTENTIPTASSSRWPKVKIDGEIQTISAIPGTAYTAGIAGTGGFDNASYGFGSTFIYSRDSTTGNINTSNGTYVINSSKNNGIKNCWLALMDIGNGNIDSNELYKVLPGEMLTVGGICTITKYLGIGVSSPKYQLDVDGDINFTGKLYNDEIEYYSNVLTLQSSNTFVTPYIAVGGVYPLVAMTSNSSGPHVASASSENPSDWQAWKAFNKVVGSEGWHTVDAYNSSDGSYSGSTSTTYDGSSTVNGEWIQLQFTTGIAINKIEIAPRTNYLKRCAGDGVVLGSNDGSTWTSIHSFSGQTYTNGTYNSITFTTSPVYTYFRLVVTKLAGTGNTTLNISEIRYTGVTLYENYVYYTGNVAVGTSTPSYTLDVAGDINFTGKLYNDDVEFLEPYSNVLNLQSSNTFVTPYIAVGGVYPLVAMTSNSSSPHVASASSENSVDWQAWKAFNKVTGDDGWQTVSAYNSSDGSYSGSTSTTYDGSSTVNGEWIQLQFTTGILLSELEIAPRTGYLSSCASDGILLGSNDGSTWTSIRSFSGIPTSSYNAGDYVSFTAAASSVYTYFRLVVTKLTGTGNTTLNIGEIRYTEYTAYENYVYYTGNVAIGTSSTASYTLDVTGDINFTDILYLNGSTGTVGQVLTSSGAGSVPTWAYVSQVGSGQLLTAGSGLSGGNYNGSSAVTWTADFSVVASTSNLNSNVSRISTLENDLTDNVVRIGNLESNLTDNSNRITIVTDDLTDNVVRIGNLESNLTDNSNRITNVTDDLTDNVVRISNLEGETQPVNRGGTGITSYTTGDILYASGATTLSKLLAGNNGEVLTSSGTGSAPTWTNRLWSSGTGTEIYYTSGNVGIGTSTPSYKLDVVGDIYASGNVTAYSDMRSKKNLKIIEDPVSKIEKINGYTYEKDGIAYTGLVAQELLEVLPEAVSGSEELGYGIAYGNMAGIFVEAIKELNSKIKALENKLSEFQNTR